MDKGIEPVAGLMIPGSQITILKIQWKIDTGQDLNLIV
jgi:hypothetical protein